MAHSKPLEVPKRIREAVRALSDVTRDSKERTTAAFAVWAWMTVPGSSREAADAGLAHLASVVSSPPIADDQRATNADDRLGPAGRQIFTKFGTSLAERIVIRQIRTRNGGRITIVIELADATLRLFSDKNKSKQDFATAAENYIASRLPNTITTPKDGQFLRKRWGARMIFLWAAHQANLPFCAAFPYQMKGKNGKTVRCNLLPVDLFAENIEIKQITNESVHLFMGLLHWGLRTYAKRELQHQVADMLGDYAERPPGPLLQTRVGPEKEHIYRPHPAETKNAN